MIICREIIRIRQDFPQIVIIYIQHLDSVLQDIVVPYVGNQQYQQQYYQRKQ